MPTAFKKDLLGDYVEVDPGSDLDYSIASWLEGMLFEAGTAWSISPNVASVLHDHAINNAPVVLDGRTYAPGEVSSMWINAAGGAALQVGVEYTVTVAGVFTGSRKDQRSFRLVVKER